jgi:acid phosphatase
MRGSLLALVAFATACSSTNDAPPPNNPAFYASSAPDASNGSDAPPSAPPVVSNATTPDAANSAAPAGLQKLNHVVVIVLENWSFDSLYSEFKGSDGLTGALAAAPQIDPSTGQAYTALPQTESHMPTGLPNAPFALDPYLGVSDDTSIDLTTNFYSEQQQIDDGKMDLFVAKSAAKGLTMGYFHTSDLPLAAEAQKYTLCDHFFHGVFGGSLQNHIFLISAAVAVFPNAPDSLKAVVDDAGVPEKNPDSGALQNGPLTPDGHVVGTVYSVNSPHPATTPPSQLLPSQTMPTIGDSLSAKNIDWAWYAGGWSAALAGMPDAGGDEYQFHHQPFVYFANYADGTPGRAAHLKDEADFITAAKAGSLPAVSFVKPAGVDNEHPNYANVLTGELHAEDLINAVRNGPNWKDSAIIVTYDENGGFWDHVAPPKGDAWGPGTRVPTLVISPFSKKGAVDSTVYEASSITALIEHRFSLAALGTRDANAADLTNAFDFGP